MAGGDTVGVWGGASPMCWGVRGWWLDLGVVGPTERGSQEPGFWDLFDLGLRSMEGEGEIGDWPAFREEGAPGGGAEGWVLEAVLQL